MESQQLSGFKVKSLGDLSSADTATPDTWCSEASEESSVGLLSGQVTPKRDTCGSPELDDAAAMIASAALAAYDDSHISVLCAAFDKAGAAAFGESCNVSCTGTVTPDTCSEASQEPSLEEVGLEEAAPGARVRIKGLKAWADLNGTFATLVKRSSTADCRWQCKLTSGELVELMPTNFEVLSEAPLGTSPELDDAAMATAGAACAAYDHSRIAAFCTAFDKAGAVAFGKVLGNGAVSGNTGASGKGHSCCFSCASPELDDASMVTAKAAWAAYDHSRIASLFTAFDKKALAAVFR
jgi:hypothetical protein